jgi:hypothetical protein
MFALMRSENNTLLSEGLCVRESDGDMTFTDPCARILSRQGGYDDKTDSSFSAIRLK